MRKAAQWLSFMVLGICAIGIARGTDLSGQDRAIAAGTGLIGSPSPRLSVKTVDGQTINLGELYGKKAVYLKFWATWCTPCREQMPHFQHTYETAGSDLAVIAVNAGFNDSVEEIEKYRQRLGITMPIVLDDGRLAAAFNLRVTPQHIVIGRNGRILYVGHLADAQLDAALKSARMTGGSAPAGVAAAMENTNAIRAFGIGDRLPASNVRTLDGQAFPMRNDRPARPTVFLFLSPWCESYLATTRPTVSANCRAAREQVTQLARGSQLRWLGIASGLWATLEDLREYQVKQKIDIPLALDESGALFRQFAVTSTPTIVLADANGRLVRRIDANELGELSQAVAGL
jgi:thiol-disulfide isomerase/thioredoxin